MDYYFDQLDPARFQRLVHALLQHQYGETLRAGPLRGADGGADAEAVVTDSDAVRSRAIQPGHHLFQIKHHRMTDADSTKLRRLVLREYQDEAKKSAALTDGKPAFFHLITNVSNSIKARQPAPDDALEKMGLTGRIWWQSDLIALLDRTPAVWAAFPELFPGGVVPLFGLVLSPSASGAAATLRAAMAHRYAVDRHVKFRQIDMERELARLFIDPQLGEGAVHWAALDFLLSVLSGRLLIEAGPGQGKSTLTQMLAQIHRHELLGRNDMLPESRWQWPEGPRVPLRVEMSRFADAKVSLEQYLVDGIVADAGGGAFTIDDLRRLIAGSPMLLVLDGLDEVGSDESRDRVIDEILAAFARFENADLVAVMTSRPPAVVGRRQKLESFRRVVLRPLSGERIDHYVERWCAMQLADERDREEVRTTIAERRHDPHVAALLGNPMQLGVLLHLIRMKGAAFPTRRAELYREYFERVIDRDVEKSAETREHRDLITRLHQFLAFEIHARAEAGLSDGTLPRATLLGLVDGWLKKEMGASIDAGALFRLGEERLGLIVTPRGEGESSVYGFEIQPIREYFAAAYIDESIEGNPHDVFAELLPRPFWHEVAMFFAGLRRPNERADLIARARAVDADPEHGWRQHGRNAIWFLLAQDIFSQPHYLRQPALEFLVERFDPEVVPFGVLPDGMGYIPTQSEQASALVLGPRIKRLLERYRTSSDVSHLDRLLAVADDVLAPDEVESIIRGLKPADAEVLPELWLREPLRLRVDGAVLPSAPLEAWARQVWQMANAEPQFVDDSLPRALYPFLLECFVGVPAIEFHVPWQTASRHLVWLIHEFETTAIELEILKDEEHARRHLRDCAARAKRVTIGGLPSDIAEPLRRLLMQTAVVFSAQGRSAVRSWADTLLECLHTPGLVSLVAARHGAALLFLDSRLDRQLPCDEVGTEVGSFYSAESLGRLAEAPWQRGPTRVLLRQGAAPVDIADVLMQCARAREPLPFDFLGRLSMDPVDAYRVTDLPAEDLEVLYETIAPDALIEGSIALSSRRSNHLLAVAERTRHRRAQLCVLAMMGVPSPAVELPIAALCAAMRADRAGRFAGRIFFEESYGQRRLLAEAIRRSPLDYAFAYRTAAAAALATLEPRGDLRPLHELRAQLGLTAGARHSP